MKTILEYLYNRKGAIKKFTFTKDDLQNWDVIMTLNNNYYVYKGGNYMPCISPFDSDRSYVRLDSFNDDLTDIENHTQWDVIRIYRDPKQIREQPRSFVYNLIQGGKIKVFYEYKR